MAKLDGIKDMKVPGAKNDSGKLQYSLIDDRAEEALAAVLTFGCGKYSAGGWRLVEGAIDRYYDAFRRHAQAFRRYMRTGIAALRIDEETGLPHTAQMLCNAKFICALDLAANDPDFDGQAAAAEALRRWRAHEAKAMAATMAAVKPGWHLLPHATKVRPKSTKRKSRKKGLRL